VITDLQAYMKASIVTHLSSSAQAADLRRPSLNSPQGNRLTTSRLRLSRKKHPLPKEPSQSLRRKRIQKATYSPPEKHAAPKTYAELLRGDTPKPHDEAGPASAKQKTLQDKQNLCQTYRRLGPTVRTPALHHQEVNSALPSGKEVETVSFVRTGIVLTPKTGTTTDDLLRCKEKIAKTLGARVEADERWVVVKVHGFPTRVTILDNNDSLSSRDVVIDQDVLPEVAGASGVSPETAYWVHVREWCPTASVGLAFRAEGLKAPPGRLGAGLKVEYPVSGGVRPHQCRRCWGLHRTEGCRDALRCRLCGDPNYRTAHHSSARTIKCANCNGQHAADGPSCPMTVPVTQKDCR
jgi:hypothetical protein